MLIYKPKKRVLFTQEDYKSLLRKNRNLSLIKNMIESRLNKKSNGKMFNIVTATWNPVTGCLYDCNYCWARELATTKLKSAPRYSKGFKPSINEKEFSSRFSKGDLVFVSDMSDMFGSFIPDEWIKRVFEYIKQFTETDFLFMTKNPIRYLGLLPFIPKNAILGATIETTNDFIVQKNKLSFAPAPSQRYEAMKSLEWDRKIVSIEPILEFDLNLFVNWIDEINPLIVYVGYDNYQHKLREPPIKDTLNLLNALPKSTLVIRKSIRPAWFECNQGALQCP